MHAMIHVTIHITRRTRGAPLSILSGMLMLLGMSATAAHGQQVATATVAIRPIVAVPASMTVGNATRTIRDAPTKRDTIVAPDTDTLDELDERPPRVAYGLAGRASSFRDGHLEYGTGLLITFAPLPGVSLGLNPSYTVATDTSQATNSGQFSLSSLPLSLSVQHDFDGALRPDVGASLGATLPLGATRDTTTRQAGYDASLGLGLSPVRGVRIGGDISRDFSSGAAAAFTRPATSSAGIDLSIEAGSRLSLGTSFSGDLGSAAAGDTLSRTVGAFASFRVLGPLALTVDGSHGIGGYAPRWAMSVGFGTAFAGVETVGPAATLTRIRRSVQRVRGRTRGNTSRKNPRTG